MFKFWRGNMSVHHKSYLMSPYYIYFRLDLNWTWVLYNIASVNFHAEKKNMYYTLNDWNRPVLKMCASSPLTAKQVVLLYCRCISLWIHLLYDIGEVIATSVAVWWALWGEGKTRFVLGWVWQNLRWGSVMTRWGFWIRLCWIRGSTLLTYCHLQ